MKYIPTFEYFVAPRTHKTYKLNEWTYEIILDLLDDMFGIEKDQKSIHRNDLEQIVSKYGATHFQQGALAKIISILEENGWTVRK